MGAKIDLTGQRYGRLTVLRDSGVDKYGGYLWLCKCDCGKTTVVSRTNLRTGHTQSCGCISRERMTNYHGIPNKHLTRVRLSMKSRCYEPRCNEYKYYGQRGIKMCDEWLGPDGRDNFVQWALDNGYREGLTIDRIDVNGDYTPENCRWVTQAEQSRNKRTNIMVMYKGQRMCVAEAARLSGIKRGTLQQRVNSGWPEDKLFILPNTNK